MSDNEDLIGAVRKLSLVVERLDKRIDSRLGALEKEISDRLGTVEHQVDEIGSGLAVVLSRNEDTKKKLPGLPIGSKSWLSVMMASLTSKQSSSPRRSSVLSRLKALRQLPEK
jgi:hypothetical protein